MDRSYPHLVAIPFKWANVRFLLPALLVLIAAGIMLSVGWRYFDAAPDAPLLTDSTLGELAVWMVDQSEQEAPPSLLGSLARTLSGGQQADLDSALNVMQALSLAWCVAIAVLGGAGVWGLYARAGWTRAVLIAALLAADMLLFFIPIVDGNNTLALLIAGIVLLLTVLLMAPGRVTNVIGFVVALSTVFVCWEVVKSFAVANDYRLTAPRAGWTYTAYPSLDDALTALQAGEVTAVFADQNDVEDLMPAYPADTDAIPNPTYPDLRYLTRVAEQQQLAFFPISPSMPGRLSIIVRAADADSITQSWQLLDSTVGAVQGDFAEENFLSLPRHVTLFNMKIVNDLNLPHLQVIAEAFLQPARRNGDFLLIRILGEAALYTWREALLGFGIGVALGFVLGTIFAHSPLMERSLLPYVVGSQTIPILAIAPMVVIWLGAHPTSVAVIAAYLTFFPVTINTLRGLQSPHPAAVELMHSYAANWWTTLWKLRFPAALPYIFTALKVSATASVVGSIVGEVASSIPNGLGRAIINLSSDYSLISTPKLWAAIISASVVGITFFVAVTLVERVVLRRYVRSA